MYTTPSYCHVIAQLMRPYEEHLIADTKRRLEAGDTTMPEPADHMIAAVKTIMRADRSTSFTPAVKEVCRNYYSWTSAYVLLHSIYVSVCWFTVLLCFPLNPDIYLPLYLFVFSHRPSWLHWWILQSEQSAFINSCLYFGHVGLRCHTQFEAFCNFRISRRIIARTCTCRRLLSMVCFSERATAKLKLMEEKQQILDEKNRRASEALARKAAGEFPDFLVWSSSSSFRRLWCIVSNLSKC